MSQPKRYAIDSDGVPYPLETGDYVRHSDYAALAAENERLRKAGDAMADTRNKPITLSEFGHLAMAWFDAKEGRDAK